MEYFVYLLYRAATAVVQALPLKFVFWLGRLLGACAYALSPKYRRLVMRNLAIAFGDEMDEKARRQLARNHFRTLGANLLSSIKVAGMKQDDLRELATVEGEEITREIVEKGQPYILVINHIGNWELFAQLIPVVLRFMHGGMIYQRLGNQYIDASVRESRARLGLTPLERKDGLREAGRILSQPGGGVGVLVDQHAGDKGIWCPFFGRLASTSPLAARLALRTRAKLIPAAVYTDGVAKWRMTILPPIEQNTDDAGVLTAEINRTLEQQIRVAPADWFWVHNRWKTPEPRFLLSSYKRGFSYPAGFDPAKSKPFRILIRSSNWLGDAVMTVPALQAIRRGRPDAHVTVLTRSKLADFWRTVVGVDDVVPIEPGEGVFAVGRKIRDRFDVAVVFPNSVRTALEVFLGGVPRRVGFPAKWRSALLNQPYCPTKAELKRPAGPPRHQVHHYLKLARFVGADIDGPVRFERGPLPPAEGEKVQLGLCPGAEYGPAKRWLPERFAEVAATVADRRNCEWLLFGTAADESVGNEIAGKLDDRCINLIGKTTLAELIDQLSRCALLLTNDTGTMHLAAYLGVPTVSIFGSTEPVLTGPLGEGHRVIRHHVDCSPCFLRECPLDFRCMKSIESDEVVEAILRMLEETRVRQVA